MHPMNQRLINNGIFHYYQNGPVCFMTFRSEVSGKSLIWRCADDKQVEFHWIDSIEYTRLMMRLEIVSF